MNIVAETPIELFFDQLRDIHSMEDQLCEAVPPLVSLCTNDGLRELIAGHARQGARQRAEVSAIFEWHGEAAGDRCKAMAGLIEGGAAHLEGVRSAHSRDLMMIAHCLRVNYYAMAAYEFTILLAGRLGLKREVGVLRRFLADEKKMAMALMLLEPGVFDTASRHA